MVINTDDISYFEDEDDVERAKVEIEARAQAMKDRLTGKVL